MGLKETDAGFTVNPGHREIVPDVYCLKECMVSTGFGDQPAELLPAWFDPGEELHSSQNAYLLVGDETLLFDTWTPMSDDTIVDELDSILDGRDLDYLAISHPEANHAGNTWTIMDAYPDATLIAPRRGVHHDFFGLDDDVVFVDDGDVIDLGGPVAEFTSPTFFDHSMTIYLIERTSETLFTVDWFGFQHMGSECLHFVDEMRYGLVPDQLARFTGYVFGWFRFVDPDRTDAAIDDVVHGLQPSVIAPAHGQVIREQTRDYLEMMQDIIRDISTDRDAYRIHEFQNARFNTPEE